MKRFVDTTTTASTIPIPITTNTIECEASAVVPPTRAPMKNRAREKMKAEKVLLRSQAQELERELLQLLSTKALERSRVSSTVWRSLAKRQAARREKSEQERERLRAQLVQQLQFAKSLEVVMQHRAQHFLQTESVDRTMYPVHNLAALHDRFMDEIDQVYPLVETLFADPVTTQEAMAATLQRSTLVSSQANGDKKVVAELRNAMYVPFAFDRVCKAVWKAVTTEYIRQQRLVEQYRCTEEEYSCSVITHIDDPEYVHPLMSGMVIRKFPETDRIVLVWRSVDWDHTSPGYRGVGDETGWIVATPAMDTMAAKPNDEGTIVRVCTRCMPVWETQAKLIELGALQIAPSCAEDSSDQASKVHEVTSSVLNATEVDLAAITESIENILLGELVGSAAEDLEDEVSNILGLSQLVHDYDPTINGSVSPGH